MADQSKSVKFGYDIEVTFVYKDKTYEIMKENISNLVINREYILKNMPTMYLSFKANPKLYNLIVTKWTNATFIIKILKYDTNTKVISKKKYINLEFNYKTNKNPDKMKTIEDSDFTEEAIKNDLYKLTVGLFLNSIIEDNKKKIINNIIKNNNMISIIHYYASHMKMLIEPFDNNRTVPNLIIEPTESITALLTYLNNICGFYKTKYLFFMDYYLAYLISIKGNIIDAKDGSYNTFKINIKDTHADNIDSSMKINNDKKLYTIDVIEKDVDVNTDDSVADKINLISGVTADGLTSNEKIDIKTSSTTKKQKYVQIHNNNFSYLKQIKADAKASSVVLEILLSNVDTTVFTPNKEYNIVNKAINKDIDGKYSLASKKEVFILGDNKFVVNTLLTLRKVP